MIGGNHRCPITIPTKKQRREFDVLIGVFDLDSADILYDHASGERDE